MSDRGDDGVDDGSAAGYDPRFDPRFQRGYTPDPAAADEHEDTADDHRTPRIDPRFDPRFQRGYDAERHEQVRRPGAAAVEDRPAYSSSVKPALLGQDTAPPVDAGHPPGAADDPRSPDPRSPAEDVDTDEPAVGAREGVRSGRNPYVIALWIVCSVLVLGGTWIVVQAAGNPTTLFVASLAVGDVFARTAWTIGPLCVTVGLLGLIALTLVHALGWLRRHPGDDR
ncbi:MAG: hypothetical protein ABWY36_01715 [Leifsonia sp.]